MCLGLAAEALFALVLCYHPVGKLCSGGCIANLLTTCGGPMGFCTSAQYDMEAWDVHDSEALLSHVLRPTRALRNEEGEIASDTWLSSPLLTCVALLCPYDNPSQGKERI